MHQDFWNIREMCDQFNVTPRTLRFYESKELLFPTRQGHKRLFTKKCRGRLKLILRGKRFGFSLEDIRQLLEMYDMGDKQQTQLLRTYELAKNKLNDLEEQRDEIEETIKELEQQIHWGKELISSMGLEKRI
ncbi:MAG: MerR family DNA-binding transcriptional regulator [Paracoccaceae bacterium]|nr:MerR family DNA-binding transcriptional regulator [Paracoccaceae bacterium]MDG1677209.1 MerR family DNA-binding transcriptional regulator [Paracoccaceae bacterium]MDG2248153.1 MerR family DNA-binding transcriptional regulator [Paracoccaceae bacterium]